MQKFIINLMKEDTDLIQKDGLECFVLRDCLPEKEISQLISEIKNQNKLVLITGEKAVELCQKYNADGVLIDLSKSEHIAKDVHFIQKQIKDKFLGVISRNRRHESMLISECEPDFVAFKAWTQGLEQTQELVSWYNEMFLIQSAVILEDSFNDYPSFECDIIITTAHDFRKWQENHS